MRKNILMLLATMLVFGSMAFAKTFTGVVSDAMCGAKHNTASDDAAACVKKCADGGSKLVVVVGSKVYNTDNQDKLKGFEGQQVKVTGTAKGDSLMISSVAAATKM